MRWRLFTGSGLDALVIYNLTLIAAFAASGLCAYVLVRELTGSTAAGVLGGVLFAFSAHRLEHFNHLELQFAFWIPLAVLTWHRAVTNGRGYVKVGLLVAAQILCCIYHGVFLLTWLAVVTAVWFFRTPVRGLRAGAAMLLPPMLVLAIYSVPYMRSRSEVGDRPADELSNLQCRAQRLRRRTRPAACSMDGRNRSPRTSAISFRASSGSFC